MRVCTESIVLCDMQQISALINRIFTFEVVDLLKESNYKTLFD